MIGSIALMFDRCLNLPEEAEEIGLRSLQCSSRVTSPRTWLGTFAPG